jgi:4-amino-4-deoxy-L-arabinose transferase-like glycosyltransferase
MTTLEKKSFFNRSWFYWATLVLLLVGGFLIRMIDLTDQPLDFHATRQLRSAVISRQIYLKMNPDADPAHAAYATDPALYDYVTRREPPITESVVALIYLMLGKEVLWVSRIVTALFWCLGGLGLYTLVKRFTSRDAALISLGVYLFMPFGVIASRSFQPEALMVAGMIWSLVCFQRWMNDRSWGNAIIAGLVTGLTILVKPNPIFMLIPAYGLTLIFSDGLGKMIKNGKIWLIAGLSAIFPLVFYLFISPGAGEFLGNFWLDIRTIIPTSRYILGWGSIITDVIPFGILVIAFVSTLLYKNKKRLIVIGLWVGYLILGIFFPHHIYTHNYYSIVLVPITAIALGQAAYLVAQLAAEQSDFIKVGLVLIGLFAMSYTAWNVYKQLDEKDYRAEPAGWKLVGDAVPEDEKTIALTHNYGTNLAYYGYRMVPLWPYIGDYALEEIRSGSLDYDFDQYFEDMTAPYDLFLVTHFGELNAQPQLMEKLSEYSVYSEGDGYIIYDLDSYRE